MGGHGEEKGALNQSLTEASHPLRTKNSSTINDICSRPWSSPSCKPAFLFCFSFILFCFVYLLDSPKDLTYRRWHVRSTTLEVTGFIRVVTSPKDFPESNSNLRKRKQKENLFPSNSLKCNLRVTKMVCVANARNLRLSREGPLPKLRYVSPSPALFLVMPVLKVCVKTCFSDRADSFPNHVTTRL